jgi:hypothetical protein
MKDGSVTIISRYVSQKWDGYGMVMWQNHNFYSNKRFVVQQCRIHIFDIEQSTEIYLIQKNKIDKRLKFLLINCKLKVCIWRTSNHLKLKTLEIMFSSVIFNVSWNICYLIILDLRRRVQPLYLFGHTPPFFFNLRMFSTIV